MADFLDYARDRLVLFDGAMGDPDPGPRSDARRFLGPGELLGGPEPLQARPRARDPPAATSRPVLTPSRPTASAARRSRWASSAWPSAPTRSTAAPPSWRWRRSRGWPRTAAPRFAVGSIGPGTRLPSLGHVAYRELEDALAVQAAGLVAGGVAALLIETCQDPLQVKAAVNGGPARHGQGAARRCR